MSASNLYALLPLTVAWSEGRVLFGVTLCASMVFSILYHMIEHHKHDMPGWGSHTLAEHHVCINLDRCAATSVVLVTLFQHHDVTAFVTGHWMILCFALLLLYVSERRADKSMYMFTHSLWHIYAFHLAYLALSH